MTSAGGVAAHLEIVEWTAPRAEPPAPTWYTTTWRPVATIPRGTGRIHLASSGERARGPRVVTCESACRGHVDPLDGSGAPSEPGQPSSSRASEAHGDATSAGRHLREGAVRRRDEVEGRMALGATPREAVRDIARSAAAEALVPGLDQTRTVGLVTLPGAFVGALLGGASPVTAAQFQLVVLVGLLCAQVITATVVVTVQGAPTRLPQA